MQSSILRFLFSFFLLFTNTLYAQEAKVCEETFSRLPNGTETQKLRDGSIEIALPENWSFFLNQGNNNWSVVQKAPLRCRCVDGPGGCNPAVFNGHVACVMTSCPTCNMINTFYAFKTSEPLIRLAGRNELSEMLPMTKEFIQIPQVTEKLNEFKKTLGLIGTRGKISEYVLVSVYGRAVLLEIREDAKIPTTGNSVKDAMVAASLSQAERFTSLAAIACRCNVSGGCKKDGMLGAHWCDASNCRDCTMTGL